MIAFMAMTNFGPPCLPNHNLIGMRPAARQAMLLLLLALCVATLPAAAQVTPRSDHGCTLPLEACTQARIAHLLEQSHEFAKAAALKPPAKLSRRNRAALNDFDNWLRARSVEAQALAQRGQQATILDEKMSFNLQYLDLQSRLQDESRRYTLISSIMKAKHDTAKNSIGNLR